MSQPTTGTEHSAWKRLLGNTAVFVVGLGCTFFFYATLFRLTSADSLVRRYLCGYWVEFVSTWLFFWSMSALTAKLWRLQIERLALAADVLPTCEKAQPVDRAPKFLDHLNGLPTGLHDTWFVRRVRSALEFVANRGTTAGLDDSLRNLADLDTNAHDSSYALIRLLTWATPIMGFLGTVLGITEAIANVTPEQLAKSISGVTDGLAVAFDTTAVALVFSVAMMFFTYAIDKAEQYTLQQVDDRVDRDLAHLFTQKTIQENQVVRVVQSMGETVLEGTQDLIERQAAIWARSFELSQARQAQMEQNLQDRLINCMNHAIEANAKAHQEKLKQFQQELAGQIGGVLAPLEKLGNVLGQTCLALERQQQRISDQAAVASRLIDGEQAIVRLQNTLQQTLQGLAQANTLEQTLHSLTALVHLLAVRMESTLKPSGKAA